MSRQVRVLLPLSDECMKEILQQVTARGQDDRAGSYEGKLLIDLADVAVVAMPEKMIVVTEN